MVNLTCSLGAVPADLPIPGNIGYAVIPSQTAPDSWMVQCCEPNPVHLIQNCWEWCELPPNLTTQGQDETQNQLNNCLNTNGRNTNHSNALEVHISGASPVELPGANFALLAILVTWLHLR
jgi:hypothetical protein